MNVIWSIAKKDLRLLLRDPKAAIILLLMPLAFILVLGISLGEDRIRVSIVNLDEGTGTGQEKWSEEVLKDLRQTAGIEVEILADEDEAKRLVANSRRAAVVIFGRDFSRRVEKCSFLAEGVNPFYREGVDLRILDAKIIRDRTQLMSASIIEQVAQGTLLRVVLPWMIGQGFAEIGRPQFIDRLSKQQKLKGTLPFEAVIERMSADRNLKLKVKVSKFLPPIDVQTVFANLNQEQKKQLANGMQKTFTLRRVLGLFSDKQKESLADGMQMTIQDLFANYDLQARNWAQLTRSSAHADKGDTAEQVDQIIGAGFFRRGAIRYQKLVPSSIVMFAFFLVLTGGWLFVAERRQGTMKRLAVAPVGRVQILLGKLLPVFLVSVFQGGFLLIAGSLLFDMDTGPQPGWLVAVVLTTSFAAMGLALMVAALAKTETQVAIYGTLLVLLLAGLSGAFMGDRSMMPELMEQISRITPHAWALDAYQQLLPADVADSAAPPKWGIVIRSCLILTAFGALFVGLAWRALRLR